MENLKNKLEILIVNFAFKLLLIQSNTDDINKVIKLLNNIFLFNDTFIIKKNVFTYLAGKYKTEIILIS